jgi:D-proline reductase (dithiol) PrdB
MLIAAGMNIESGARSRPGQRGMVVAPVTANHTFFHSHHARDCRVYQAQSRMDGKIQGTPAMSIQYMQAIRARYESLGYTPYRWFEADSAPPWQPMGKPLSSARLGLLSTSGAYALGQCAYHYKDDTSIRALPSSIEPRDLRFSHITENYLVDAKRDPDCILPLTSLRTLVAEGVVGELAEQVFSCMGGVYSQRRIREDVAPALLTAFRAQQVDCALLVAM